MKHFTRFCLTLALFTSVVISRAQEIRRAEFFLATGVGQEQLHWTIAGNLQGKNPNILSELKWNKIRGPVLNLGAMLRVKQRFLIRLSSSYQKTNSGSATDTDYQGDNRTNKSFFAHVDADRGFAFSYNGQIGYDIILNKRLSIQPWLGYTHDQILLRLIDDESFGNQKLDSRYENFWMGWTMSLFANFNVVRRLSISAGILYKQLRYDATADWNLIEEFQHPESFKHYAKGFGIANSVKIEYQVSKQIWLSLQSEYQIAETGKGTDTVFFTSGQTTKTQLNGVQRKSASVMVGITMKL